MENNERAVLAELNEEQTAAVTCLEGPVLIVAGAGSGKTRVLTSRVALLLARGADPSRILALTFTKKAAGEMKDRIAAMVGWKKARHVVMGTFHSIFVRFLRTYAESIGYPKEFTIYDQSDQVSAVKASIKDLGLDDTIYKPREVLSRISGAKNSLVTVSAYRADQAALRADAHARKPRIVDVYDRYQQRLKQSGVMDFDDILVNMNILLRDNPTALEEIRAAFSYIMVDEYQDTNYSQYLIIRKLAARHHNVCVVGDDSQSIYAFRGAQIQNILNFRKDYPDSRIFRLESNYRSTSTIVDAANSLIAHNTGRIPKNCYAVGEEGEKIGLIKAYTEQDEAFEIVSSIQSRMRRDGAMYRDFAILYRTNAQSRALEEQLRRRNMPYIIYSGNSFYERVEVKDLMAYFKLAVNPQDEESFKRVVNKPARGIGDTTMKALEAAATASSVSIWNMVTGGDLAAAGIRDAAAKRLRDFCALIDSFAARSKGTDAFTLARAIADESGMMAFYQSDNSVEGQARLANVQELVNSVASFIEERKEENEDPAAVFTLGEYLENVSLLSNADVASDEDNSNKVSLMTAHSAKGLEFPYVYVAGMEDNLFPSQSMTLSLKDIEEERRLFYVAVTRAKKHVTLSYAGTRMRNGRHESNPPSRFLREIDPQYLVHPIRESEFDSDSDGGSTSFGGFGSKWNTPRTERIFGSRPHSTRDVSPGGVATRGSINGRGPQAPQGRSGRDEGRGPEAGGREVSGGVRTAANLTDVSFVPLQPEEVKAGMRIEHNRFGTGVVLDVTGSGPDRKARVKFDVMGEKLLLLKYAKMRPVE